MARKARSSHFVTSAAVRELARLARKLRKIESSAQFLYNGKPITLSMTTENEDLSSVFVLYTSLAKEGETVHTASVIQRELQRMLDHWLHATLLPDTITVKTSSEGDLSEAGMRDLLRRVWAEASGISPDSPPPQAAKKRKKKLTAEEFDRFMKVVAECSNQGKLQRALDMLKAESFQLYSEMMDHQLVGVVRSQTKSDLIYSCHLNSQGRYGCCTPDLHECWGMRKELCKHLLVLIIGLTKSGQIDPETMALWVQVAARKKPSLHEELLSETLLKYKGAEAGEIDWRPTETIPEDYFAY